MKRITIYVNIFAFILFVSVTAVLHGDASAEDTKNSPSSLVISATRYEKPESEVPINITVIPKEEISNLPVHDIGEALNYIPGLVIDRSGGPGGPVVSYIQGSEKRHVKVLIDDIPLELLSEGVADLSTIPIENVERVEILKGSASSAWGSSLGGAINIITRQPSDKLLTEVGASAGEEGTRRYSGLVSGKAAGIGYFLSASRFETSGFFDNQNVNNNNIYAKLTNSFGRSLKAELSYGYNDTDRGQGRVLGANPNEKISNSYGKLKLDYNYNKNLDLSLALYSRVFDGKITGTPMSPSGLITDRENFFGVIFKSDWRHSDNGILFIGAEGNKGTLSNSILSKDYDSEKKAVYANESLGFGNLNLNLAARFDDDSVYGSEISPSAGAVYDFKSALTLLRLNVSRGFTPPPLTYRFAPAPYVPNPDLTAERSWNYQAGIKSTIIPWLWVKATIYRSDISDAIGKARNESGLRYFKNFRNFRRQGVEAELRTAEYTGLSLSYGYTFNDVKNLDNDTIVQDKPRVTHDAGLEYRGPYEIRGVVKGHYVWWNASDTNNSKDKDFIWDAKISKYLAKWKSSIGELFFSVHNITDEKQYLMDTYPNPGRWVEAGVNLTFF